MLFDEYKKAITVKRAKPKENNKSNYRTDNDIFGIRDGKVQYYNQELRKVSRDNSENRLGFRLRVIIFKLV